ncbi:YoaK family protein [Roseiterribacter gracilis]|uniref:DUF1275 family protein n=1 Tax=Roseiterribacter gracilis TaxID=2812848 RepID=A0A8S8X6N9_9PROT|nr:DUF1275 family protein [Rhodospirillales bacterium TMPK1]
MTVPGSGFAAARSFAIAAAIALGFVAGFVDTCGFVALFGLFTAHVTGNFVLIGAAVVGSGGGIWAKLAAFPIFVTAVAGSTIFARSCARSGSDAMRPLLLVQLALLLAFAVAGIRLSPFHTADAAATIATGMLGVAAMGVQNAASRLVFLSLAPTTVMTGNVTQLIIDLVDLACGTAEEAARDRLRRMAAPVLAFTAGALSGGLLYMAAGFACLVLPIVLLALVAFLRPAPTK